VRESAATFRRLHADVFERIIPGLPHTVNEEEIATVANIVGHAGAGPQ
jgi:hypothetical protein